MRKKKKTIILILFIIVLLLVSFLSGLIIGIENVPPKVIKEIRYETINQTIIKKEIDLEENEVYMKIPAVDNYGNGEIADLYVKVKKGDGNILVNINDVLADFDTQYSARIAAQVASDSTKIDISNLDIIYKIKTKAPLISGMSAGSSMSIATIAALQSKELNKNIILTGTIMPNGDIGQVGAIFAKAKEAKENNIKTFLVPIKQSSGIIYKEEKICKKAPGFSYCRINYIPKIMNISKELGINIIEVRNIEDTIKYFFE